VYWVTHNKASMHRPTDFPCHSNQHPIFETSKTNENYLDASYRAAQVMDMQGTWSLAHQQTQYAHVNFTRPAPTCFVTVISTGATNISQRKSHPLKTLLTSSAPSKESEPLQNPYSNQIATRQKPTIDDIRLEVFSEERLEDEHSMVSPSPRP